MFPQTEIGSDPAGTRCARAVATGAPSASPAGSTGAVTPAMWLRGWQRAGATHASLDTMGAGCATASDHVAAFQAAMAAWTEAEAPA